VFLDGRGSDFTESNQTDDRDRLLFSWSFVSTPDGSNATLLGSELCIASFVADREGIYEIELKTRVKELPEPWMIDPYSTDTMRVVASSGNCAPVAEAGPHQEVKPGTLVTLDGTMSSDADGDDLTYSWSFDADSPTAILSDEASSTPSFMPQHGDYRLRLVVHDGSVQSAEDFVTVRASSGTSRPVAIAGSDRSVDVGTTVTLDGSGSFDADGDDLKYHWRILWSSAEVSLTNKDQASALLHTYSGGYCLVQLHVNDGYNDCLRLRDDTNLDRVMIHVIAAENHAPVADAGSDHPSETVGEEVFLYGGGSYDPDNDSLHYAWSFHEKPLGSSATLVYPNSSSPYFTPDIAGDYVIKLVVFDGELTSQPDYVTVTATSGAGPTALTLQTTLPFTPVDMEVPIQIQIDADGSDTIRVISASSPEADTDYTVLQGNLNVPADDEGNFYTINSAWTLISRTHDNPVHEDDSPSFIVQRTSDAVYYRIDLGFYGVPANTTLTVDGLSAWRCGGSQGDCP
jgi:hypothetical protein